MGRYDDDRPRLIAFSSGPRHESPIAAAAALRTLVDVVRLDLRHGRITPVEAIDSVHSLHDQVESSDIGVGRGDDYLQAQIPLLAVQAEALTQIAEMSDDPRITRYAALANEMIPIFRDQQPGATAADLYPDSTSRSVQIAIELSSLRSELGLQ